MFQFYPSISLYSTHLNSPIIHKDEDGKNPALVIGGISSGPVIVAAAVVVGVYLIVQNREAIGAFFTRLFRKAPHLPTRVTIGPVDYVGPIPDAPKPSPPNEEPIIIQPTPLPSDHPDKPANPNPQSEDEFIVNPEPTPPKAVPEPLPKAPEPTPEKMPLRHRNWRIPENPPFTKAEDKKECYQYVLKTRSNGFYPVLEEGDGYTVETAHLKPKSEWKYLQAGESWKFGTSTHKKGVHGRYTQANLDGLNLDGINQFKGTKLHALLLEKAKIITYWARKGFKPYGNKNTR
jgi:hypothetical protein